MKYCKQKLETPRSDCNNSQLIIYFVPQHCVTKHHAIWKERKCSQALDDLPLLMKKKILLCNFSGSEKQPEKSDMRLQHPLFIQA